MSYPDTYVTVRECRELYPQKWVFLKDYVYNEDRLLIGGKVLDVCEDGAEFRKIFMQLERDGVDFTYFATYPVPPLTLL